MQLGQMIAKIRKEQGMTQETFAKKFDVTRQTVSNWENEKSYPDLHTLIKISDEFNLSLDVLLKGDTTMVKDIDKKIKKHSLYKGVIVVLVFMVVGLFAFIQFNNESMNDTAKDYMDNYVISAMMATAPFAQTPRMTVTTELKSANFKGGRSSVRIQLYGVPEIFRSRSTISFA